MLDLLADNHIDTAHVYLEPPENWLQWGIWWFWRWRGSNPNSKADFSGWKKVL